MAVFRWMLIPIWVLGLVVFGLSFYEFIPYIQTNLPLFQYFLYGMGAYVVLEFLLLGTSQNIKWARTFSHESTHILFLLLFFKKIEGFSATARSGGEVAYHGGGNFIISLTPYCFPLFTIPLLLIRPLFIQDILPYYDFVIGVTYAFHLSTFLRQTRFFQTDLQKHGLLFSTLFILFINALLVGIIFAFLDDGYLGAYQYIVYGFRNMMEYGELLLGDLGVRF